MASSDIGRHYRVYKQGGEQIARWLVSTAADRDRNRSTSDKTTSVSTTRLLELAKSIASYRPPVHISNHILDLIAEVIDGRENCANFYVSQGLDCSGHRHYIQVLRQVQKVLKQVQSRHGERLPPVPARSRCQSNGPLWAVHEPEASATVAEFLESQDPPLEGWTVVCTRGRRRSTRVL